jgi:hypothetical protein
MNLSDIPLNPTRRALRQFAVGWLIFFSAFGAHQYFVRGHHPAGIVLMSAAVIFGVLGIVRPGAVRWIFVTWMVLAFPIGWVLSQLMLLVMFYVLLTPVSLILRLKGRDLLERKPRNDQSTCWSPKEAPKDVRSYFRQY